MDASKAPPENDELLRLVQRRVRARFTLSLEAFAERALQIARVAFPRGPWPEAVLRLSLDDLYLASACGVGDPAAWRELTAEHAGFIRAFARRRLPESEAGELADQVLADLWQRGKIARFEGRSALRTWLAALVAHAAVNQVKARRPTESLESEAFRAWARQQEGRGGEASEIASRTARTLSELVADALGGAAMEDKLLLLLHYEQGMTLDQISRVHGASKSTLSRRLEAIRRSIRLSIEEEARRLGTSADDLRAGLDLGGLALDLERLLRPSDREGWGGPLSKPVKGSAQ